MYRSPLLDSACPVCKRGKNVYDYDYVLRPAETLAFTNDTFYKRLQLRFDYGWTNRKSRTLMMIGHNVFIVESQGIPPIPKSNRVEISTFIINMLQYRTVHIVLAKRQVLVPFAVLGGVCSAGVPQLHYEYY